MKNCSSLISMAVIFTGSMICSCIQSSNHISRQANSKTVLLKHLEAVANKNLSMLEETLSPEGDMWLILPNSEPSTTVKDFLTMHEEWFQDTTWTFETTISHFEAGRDLASATVKVMYKEPDRNGKPYFNKMMVSYVLKLQEGQWYVIKDHACSIDKSEG